MSRELFDPYNATPHIRKTQYDGQVLRRKKVDLKPGCFKKSDVETAVQIMKSFGYYPYLYRPLVYPHYSYATFPLFYQLDDQPHLSLSIYDITNLLCSSYNMASLKLPTNDIDNYRIFMEVSFHTLFQYVRIKSLDDTVQSFLTSRYTGTIVPYGSDHIDHNIFIGAFPTNNYYNTFTYLQPVSGSTQHNVMIARWQNIATNSFNHGTRVVAQSEPNANFYLYSADFTQSNSIALYLNEGQPYPIDEPDNYLLIHHSFLTNDPPSIQLANNGYYLSLTFQITVVTFDGNPAYQFPQ